MELIDHLTKQIEIYEAALGRIARMGSISNNLDGVNLNEASVLSQNSLKEAAKLKIEIGA